MRPLSVLVWMFWGACAQAQDAPKFGIFGTVETVTPLVVAGVQITVPDGLPVLSPLGQGVVERGDTLALVAVLSEGGLVAARMLEIYPVVGQVDAREGDTAWIMGTSVHVPPDADMPTGARFAVSGLWSGEMVITSNLRTVDQSGFAHLTGIVMEEASFAEGRVGGSVLRGIQRPDDGFGTSPWIFSGIAVEDGLQVQLMTSGVFGGPVDLALWQGYATGPVASQTYMIHGTEITGTARDAQMPLAGVLVTRCVKDGRVVVAPPAGLDAGFAALKCAKHTPAG